ncbi:GDSL-type esterase/lipase family protein [Rubritalea tangerina]|uniref:GDSL-type esterase/lipase family protein n=1 Tax=Rubritalea tangerina TaxID=430798 RepID=A0ABW4Z941_9BACT
MMCHFKTLSLILSLAFTTPLTSKAGHYKVILLTGDSNALGMTASGENDTSPGSDPADQSIQFFWNNRASATTTIGTSSDGLTSLQSQQGNFILNNTTHWGPEIQMGRTLYRAGVKNAAIIKVTSAEPLGNSAWIKGGAAGYMYSQLIDSVTAATTTLTQQGHTYEICGLIYQQGENDSPTEAPTAGTRIMELIANLRADLPNASAIHTVISGAATNNSVADTLHSQHIAIAAANAEVSFVSNLDLNAYLYNGIHTNKDAKLVTGERAALALLDAGAVSRHYGMLAFIGDSITQGGNGDHPSYRYNVFAHLALKSVPNNASTGYKFVGSVTGPYNNSTLTTPDINGQSFENVHEGHYGWRAFWLNGRKALPSNRRSANRGEGTILNWTNQASPQEYDLNSLGNKVAYPDPTASGTGNTGTTYTPDTVVMLIGINDLGDWPYDAVQANADISLMIDQLRAANPNVHIHLNLVLPTDRGLSWESTKIDELNGYLVSLAETKNAESTTSPVWIVDAASGFTPSTMAYDRLHPNALGEAHIGDLVAASLGLTESPLPAAPVTPPHIESSSTTFSHNFEGNAIYNGSNYINNWTEHKGSDTTEGLATDETNLRHTHINGSDSWIAGTNTGWADIHKGDWTWETRLKFHANPNGYFLWIGTGNGRIYIEIHGDKTNDYGSQNFTTYHNNTDGAFHTFRVLNDSSAGKYHVFRDGVRLTNMDGVAYDSYASESRFFMGDYTSGGFGDNYDVEIDYVRYDQGGLYLPPGADSDNDGLSDAWEYQHFGHLTSTHPNADGDSRSNLEEYLADTIPTNPASQLTLQALTKVGTTTTLTINSSLQRNYSLYRSSDLGTQDPWSIVDGPLSGNGSLLLLKDTSSHTKAFYKVEVSTQ